MSSQEQNSNISIAIAIITAVTGLGVALFNNWDKLFSESKNLETIELPSEDQRLTVHFDVREENENSLSDAEVRFAFEGAPILKRTDHNGYTLIELPKRDGIEVTVRKQGFVTKRLNVNLLADPRTIRTIYLTREDLPREDLPIQDPRNNFIPPSSDLEEQAFQSSLTWRSETNKTRLPELDKACFGESLLENIETVFGYNNPPFNGTIYIESPRQEGCVPEDILRGSFDLIGNAGKCVGDVIITWKNMNRAHIKWAISNLGSSCSVGSRSWEISVYPVRR